MTNKINAKDLLIGAAIGGVLGTIASLLNTQTTGSELRKGFIDTCQNLAEKASCLTAQQKCQAEKAGKSLCGRVIQPELNGCHHCQNLVIGGIAGGIAGALAGLLLAPKSGEALRKDIVDAYQDVSKKTGVFTTYLSDQGQATAQALSKQVGEWLDTAKNVLGQVSSNVDETIHNVEETVQKERKIFFPSSAQLNELLDWASLGVRLWQKKKK